MNLKKQYRTQIVFIFLYLLFSGIHITSQASSSGRAHKNLDPILINGKKYVLHSTAINGHQYIASPTFENGSVTIKGEVYKNVMLNLDVYTQELVLSFKTAQGSNQLISMSDAWITNFSIGDRNFVFRTSESGTKDIYQTIGNDDVKILYQWEKSMRLNPNSGKHYFTSSAKKSYALINGEVKRFKSNRSFIECFDDSYKELLKKYIKENRIRVSKLNDSDTQSLTNYCNNIIKN